MGNFGGKRRMKLGGAEGAGKKRRMKLGVLEVLEINDA